MLHSRDHPESQRTLCVARGKTYPFTGDATRVEKKMLLAFMVQRRKRPPLKVRTCCQAFTGKPGRWAGGGSADQGPHEGLFVCKMQYDRLHPCLAPWAQVDRNLVDGLPPGFNEVLWHATRLQCGAASLRQAGDLQAANVNNTMFMYRADSREIDRAV